MKSYVFFAIGQLGRVASLDRLGPKRGVGGGRRGLERGAVLPDTGHAGRRGVRAGHRPAGHAAHVWRPDHSTGALHVYRRGRVRRSDDVSSPGQSGPVRVRGPDGHVLEARVWKRSSVGYGSRSPTSITAVKGFQTGRTAYGFHLANQ